MFLTDLVKLVDKVMSCFHEGNKYNIPVCVWIHETHPKNPPRCFVCPSPTMVINAKSSNVDASGCVLLHCLSNWKIVRQFHSQNTFFAFLWIMLVLTCIWMTLVSQGWSNLSIVLEEMIAAFQREPPLFVTYPIRASSLVEPVHPSPVTSYGRLVIVC